MAPPLLYEVVVVESHTGLEQAIETTWDAYASLPGVPAAGSVEPPRVGFLDRELRVDRRGLRTVEKKALASIRFLGPHISHKMLMTTAAQLNVGGGCLFVCFILDDGGQDGKGRMFVSSAVCSLDTPLGLVGVGIYFEPYLERDECYSLLVFGFGLAYPERPHANPAPCACVCVQLVTWKICCIQKRAHNVVICQPIVVSELLRGF